jgi:hypothetical protein
MTIETQTATTFDYSKTYGNIEEAQEAAKAADISNFRITKNGDEWMIIDATPKAATKAAKAEKAATKPTAKDKAKKGGRKSAAAKNEEAAKAIETAKAKREAAKANPAPTPTGKDMHYSRDDLRLLSPELIGAGLKGMNRKDQDDFRNALKGELPKDPPFGPAATHDPFRKSLKELDDLRERGDLEGLEAWKGGKGTRMTCSSTIPLGRYHQKLLLAFRALNATKLAAKAKREANKAAKAAKNGNGQTAEQTATS